MKSHAVTSREFGVVGAIICLLLLTIFFPGLRASHNSGSPDTLLNLALAMPSGALGIVGTSLIFGMGCGFAHFLFSKSQSV